MPLLVQPGFLAVGAHVKTTFSVAAIQFIDTFVCKITMVNPVIVGLLLLNLVVVPVFCVDNVEKFYQLVKKLPVISDKITTHSYQEIYGEFLLPFIKKKRAAGKNIKFFEIGLGCDNDKFYGGSVEIWNALFSANDELWAADYRGNCIDKARAEGKLYNIKTMVGNQEDIPTLQKWMNISGGNFDIIVDDGGHLNKQIYNTVQTIWSSLAPGGLYFIEDLQIGRNFNETLVMSDVIRDWIEQLIINKPYPKFTHKILPGMKAIYCQAEACVLIKCHTNDITARGCSK